MTARGGGLFGSKIVLNLKTNQQAQNIGKQFLKINEISKLTVGRGGNKNI